MILLTPAPKDHFHPCICWIKKPSDQGNRRPWDNNSESGVTCAKLCQMGVHSSMLFFYEKKKVSFIMEQEQTKACW